MQYQTYTHTRNWGCRVHEFTQQGYRCVALENEKLRITVVADKGSDIYEFLYKPLDVDFLWRSRTGLQPPRFVQSSPRLIGSHSDYYEGGWQELFPNCGAASVHQGAEIGQHGEVLLLPWNYVIVRNEPDIVQVQFEVRTVRTPFHILKTLELRRNESRLRIHERVTNESGQSVDFIWGHHPALGPPFIDETCRVDLPPCRILITAEFTPETSRLKSDQDCEWPFAEGRNGGRVDLSRLPGPAVAASDMVFLEGLQDGWFAVTNTSKNVGFAMRFPHDVFKTLWYWQVYRGGRDYPWWNATYNIALEPCVSTPMLERQARAGRALSLGAGESMEVEFWAIAYTGLESVKTVTPDGEVVGG